MDHSLRGLEEPIGCQESKLDCLHARYAPFSLYYLYPPIEISFFKAKIGVILGGKANQSVLLICCLGLIDIKSHLIPTEP